MRQLQQRDKELEQLRGEVDTLLNFIETDLARAGPTSVAMAEAVLSLSPPADDPGGQSLGAALRDVLAAVANVPAATVRVAEVSPAGVGRTAVMLEFSDPDGGGEGGGGGEAAAAAVRRLKEQLGEPASLLRNSNFANFILSLTDADGSAGRDGPQDPAAAAAAAAAAASKSEVISLLVAGAGGGDEKTFAAEEAAAAEVAAVAAEGQPSGGLADRIYSIVMEV